MSSGNMVLNWGEEKRIEYFNLSFLSSSDQKPASMEAWLTQPSEIIFLEHMAGQRMDEIYVKNVFYLVHYTQNIIMSTCKQYKHYYDDIFYSLVLSLQIQYVFYIPSTSQFRPAPFPGFISHLWPVASTLEGVILTCCQYHWT